MAARTRKIKLDQKHKDSIRASQIENRLVKHMLSDVPIMAQSQVTAALGVLKKYKPDLAAVEHSGDVQTTYVARMPAPVADMAAWSEQHATDTAPTQPIDTKH